MIVLNVASPGLRPPQSDCDSIEDAREGVEKNSGAKVPDWTLAGARTGCGAAQTMRTVSL